MKKNWKEGSNSRGPILSNLPSLMQLCQWANAASCTEKVIMEDCSRYGKICSLTWWVHCCCISIKELGRIGPKYRSAYRIKYNYLGKLGAGFDAGFPKGGFRIQKNSELCCQNIRSLLLQMVTRHLVWSGYHHKQQVTRSACQLAGDTCWCQ